MGKYYLESNFLSIKKSIPKNIKILIVSKNQNIYSINKLYNLGHRDFGENYVQEMKKKYNYLPKNIRWHMIGKIQKNKLKYIIPFVHLIHSIQKIEHIEIINKISKKLNKISYCLLQIKICYDKSGITMEQAIKILDYSKNMNNIQIIGLMGMASINNKKSIINKEFFSLYKLYNNFKTIYGHTVLSIGMSKDYLLAIKNGSTIVRLGSIIFGHRNNLI